MTQADDNVELVRRGFAAYDAGDLDTVIEMWHPDVVYHGWSVDGERKEFRGRDAFFGMLMEAVTKLDENKQDLVSITPVGDEIVMCQLRGHRRAKGSSETKTYDFVMVLRLQDGQVIHGSDMADSKAESFWRSLN